MKAKKDISLRKHHSLGWVIKHHWDDYLFSAPYVILFMIFTVIPVLMAMFLSLTYFNALEAPKLIWFENFFQLLVEDELFMISLKNTLILSVITGPVGYLLSVALAWLVNEFGNRTRAVLTLLFYAPVLAGGAFSIWSIIYSGDQYGLLNSILLEMGIIYTPIQWLTDSTYMMPAAIIVILWLSFGTGFLSLIAGFKNVDVSMYEAAAVDGIKNRYQELWYITLPSMKETLCFSAVMSITGAFGTGGVITALFGFPSTNYALHTLVHHMEDFGNIRMEMGYACAIAVVLFVIQIVCNSVIQRILRKVGS